MIQTALIIWAVLATGLGIASAVITERAIREARAALALADEEMGLRNLTQIEAGEYIAVLSAAKAEVEATLEAILGQRSETTRRGNLTRSAKRRAAVASTTEQIRKEIGR